MPLPSLTELGQAEFMSPMMFQQAQNQIDLGNQQAQQGLDQGAANLQSTGLANMFAEQNNPLLVQGNKLLNESRGLSNRRDAVDTTTKEELAPLDREKKRAEMLRSVDEDRLKSLYARGEAGMIDPDPKIAEAAKKMRSSAWDELQRRNKATDAYDKALAVAEGKLEGIRLQQMGAGERGEAANASRERIAALRAQKSGDQASSILKGVSEGKFGYERAASSFGILAALAEDPAKAEQLNKIAQFFEKARASDVNRQLGKVDLKELGLDINEFQSVLGGLGGVGAGTVQRPVSGNVQQTPTNYITRGGAEPPKDMRAVAQEQVKMFQSELDKMGPNDPDRPALERQMARLGGAPAQAAGGMVSVVKPDGTTGQIPAEKLKAALAAGYKQR